MNKIAETIFNQIGGNFFCVMTGAKNFVYSHNSLQFSFPLSMNKNKCVIIYNEGRDTYTVQFWRVKKYDWVLRSDTCDVYASDLQRLFESETGLYTKI